MLIGSSASSAALALLVVRRHLPINTRTQFFGSIIYNRSSTNAANLAKIGPVDVEIIRLTSTAPLYISVSITLMFFFLVPFQNIFLIFLENMPNSVFNWLAIPTHEHLGKQIHDPSIHGFFL